MRSQPPGQPWCRPHPITSLDGDPGRETSGEWGGRDKHTGKEGIAVPTGMDGCCMKLLKKSQRRTIVRHGAWSRPGPAACCLLRRPSVLPTFLLLHSRSGRSSERLYPPQVPGVAVTPQRRGGFPPTPPHCRTGRPLRPTTCGTVTHSRLAYSMDMHCVPR